MERGPGSGFFPDPDPCDTKSQDPCDTKSQDPDP